MAAHSSKTWLQIRTAYVVRGWSAQQCADEFGIDRATISRRASKEGWTQERHRTITEAQQHVTDTMVSATQDALVLHASIADQIAQAVSKGMDEWESMPPGRSKAETLRVYAEAADKAIRLGRDVRGIRPGQSSDGENEGEKGRKIVFATVEEEQQEIA